jgi:GH24 family phage-related lysozyme (muramidase)
VRAFSRKYGLNQCQFDALMSFIFNAGAKSFKSLTAGVTLQNWLIEIPTRLIKYRMGKNPNYDPKNPTTPKYIPIPELVKRRFTESKWFLRSPCPCQGVAVRK